MSLFIFYLKNESHQIKHFITSDGMMGEFTRFELLVENALIAACAAGTIARDAC